LSLLTVVVSFPAGLIAALMVFSLVSLCILGVLCDSVVMETLSTQRAQTIHRVAQSLKTKTVPPSVKGWNGHVWLFLPSTVLTVSGSRGLTRSDSQPRVLF